MRDIANVNILFNERMGPVDPFSQYSELPRMLYLEFDSQNTLLTAHERKQLNNDEERQALLDQSLDIARGNNQYACSLAAQEQEQNQVEA